MELEMFLGMSEEEANSEGWRETDEGSKLAGNSDLWLDGNLKQNPEFGISGFNALPAGYRGTNMGNTGSFWLSSDNSSSHAGTGH